MARHADTPVTEVSDSKTVIDAPVEDDGMAPAQHQLSTIDDVGDADDKAFGTSEFNDEDLDAPSGGELSPIRTAAILSVTIVAVLIALVGWLGYRAHQSHDVQQQRQLFVQAARQGALNLTTIDHSHVDADVARILDSATGAFYDEFKQRAQPFVQVVKQAQSKSEGSISEAGLESVTGDEAQVLVAVKVNTSLAGVPEPEPRGWRMRMNVKEIGDNAIKVSNVVFVQ